MNLLSHHLTPYRALLCAGLLAGLVPAQAQNAASAGGTTKTAGNGNVPVSDSPVPAKSTPAVSSTVLLSSLGRPVEADKIPAALVASLVKADPNTGPVDKNTLDRKAIDDAKTLIKAGNVAAAEQALTKRNRAKPNTAEWHAETTQKLVQTAQELAREGNSSSIADLATLSLQHLNEVGALSQNAQVKAHAKSQAAYIYARFVGDTPAAIASYQAAVKLDPTDVAAQQALERLQNSEANLRARIKSQSARP
jgi:tetratricopeptide (TPR) repeat protein